MQLTQALLLRHRDEILRIARSHILVLKAAVATLLTPPAP